MKQPHCNLCHSLNTNRLFEKSDAVYYTCIDCGFTFSCNKTNPNFENSIDDFEPSYLAYFGEQPSDKRNHESLLNWINTFIQPENAALLDIGCGSGKWVSFLHQWNIPATGIEPSAVLFTAFLTGKQGFLCTSSTELLKNFPGKQYDIITVFDVLEHSRDPLLFIQEISALLKPGGFVFISTPDVSSLHRKLTGKWWHYFNHYHASFFSKQTLSAAAEKAGLELTHTSYRSRYFSLDYIWTYFKNFLLKKKSPLSGPKKWLFPVNLFDNMYAVLRKTQ